MCFLDSNRSSHLTNGLPQGFFWLREPSFGAAVGGHSIPCAISWCDRRPWQALDSCQDTALAFGIKDCEAAVSRCLLVAGFHLNWHLQGLLPCLQYMYIYIYIYTYIYIYKYIYIYIYTGNSPSIDNGPKNHRVSVSPQKNHYRGMSTLWAVDMLDDIFGSAENRCAEAPTTVKQTHGFWPLYRMTNSRDLGWNFTKWPDEKTS